MSNIIIIGGGASGICAAITLSRNNHKVTILERNNICGKKLLITGNGRCNYFNDDFNIKHYTSSNNELLQDIINENSKEQVLAFFNSIGIIPNIKNGYYYPYSNQATSIKNTLDTELKNLNVEIIYNTYVEDIVKEANKFTIKTNNRDYISDKVIVAAGSYAYPKTGSEGNLYDVLKKIGHTIVEPLPALVQLKTNEKYLKEWKGIRTKATTKLYIDNTLIKEEKGEIQLTDYGISGICIMNLSTIAARKLTENKKVEVEINFYNEIDNIDNFISFMDKRNSLLKNRTVSELLDSIINYKLGNLLIRISNIDINSKWNDLSVENKKELAKHIISHKVNIVGTNSYDNAQTCSGGVKLSEINLSSMESKIVDNLYIIGEILDITGDCGGYNLGLCFLTGIKVGNNIK